AHREIGTLQSFTASDVDDVRIRWRDRDGADGLRRLIVENRRPGQAVVARFPDAAVVDADVEDIRLLDDARRADCPPAAKRSHVPPAHLLKFICGVRLQADHADSADRHDCECDELLHTHASTVIETSRSLRGVYGPALAPGRVCRL